MNIEMYQEGVFWVVWLREKDTFLKFDHKEEANDFIVAYLKGE
jgi:hypothetical protein